MPENPLQIYLCRHGETAWTVSGQHTGKTDVPLTERGRMQAECLKKRLAGIPFDAVLSSPLQRASETCHLAGFHPILEPNAAEWNYGDFEGLTYQQICEKKHPWSIFLNGAQGGESLMQVSHRADLVLQRLLSHGKRVALFSHGHFLRVLTARWLGLEASEGRLFALSVASVGILSFERDQRVLTLWNDTSHL